MQKERDELRAQAAAATTATTTGTDTASASGSGGGGGRLGDEAGALVKSLRSQLGVLQAEVARLRTAQKAEMSDAARAIVEDSTRSADEKVAALLQELANSKANETALMEDVEETGQALDDMQEQNARLLRDLKSKEARDLRNLEERLKSSQLCKALTEEKAALERRAEAERSKRRAEEESFRTVREMEARVRRQLEDAARRMHDAERQCEQTRAAAGKHELEASQAAAQLAQVCVPA